MTRAAYVKYGVAQLWLENVVDDCSLTALLQVRGAKVRLCPGALLHTDAVNHSTPVWRAWMDRQVLFLKFCMPGQWKLLGLMCVMMALPMVCAALAFLGWIVNVGSGAGVLLGLFWLAAMVSALHLWRGLLAKPVPLWRWCMIPKWPNSATASTPLKTAFCTAASATCRRCPCPPGPMPPMMRIRLRISTCWLWAPLHAAKGTISCFGHGGLWIAGGIAAKNPLCLTHPAFLQELGLVPDIGGIAASVPIYLIADGNSGLWGAACAAVEHSCHMPQAEKSPE